MSEIKFQCRILKIVEELRLVTGPVLRSGVRDRHGTRVSKPTIRVAAHAFMVDFRAGESTSGYMHRDFYRADERFRIVESYLAPVDFSVPRTERMTIDGEAGDGDIQVSEGDWMMTVEVLDDGVWEQVKSGIVKGFSIGGVADIVPEEEAT